MKNKKEPKKNEETTNSKLRKIYVDLFINENVKQLENFPSNMIRTTKYKMQV